MAAKPAAGKAKTGVRSGDARALPDDEKQLQRMAALLSAHPDMALAEALEAIGVDDAKGQRRLHKLFEARREELIGAIEVRRERRTKDAVATGKAAALQIAKEPSVSAPMPRARAAKDAAEPTAAPPRKAPQGAAAEAVPATRPTAARAEPAAAPAVPAPAAPAPASVAHASSFDATDTPAAARATDAARPSPMPSGAPPCASALPSPRVASGAATPWLKAGADAFSTGLRMHAAVVEAWLKLPPVSFALSQQAAAYNALLTFASSAVPKAK